MTQASGCDAFSFWPTHLLSHSILIAFAKKLICKRETIENDENMTCCGIGIAS